MSMLKKLKGIFVVEDGSAPAADPSKKAEPTIEEIEKSMKSSPSSTKVEATSSETSGNTNNVGSQSSVNTESSNTKPDAKFINVLLKALEANNQEGFDYLEYKQSLQNLSSVDMDETTKYKSALAMAKTMGAKPSSLIASAKKYIKVLDQEGAKFKQASDNQKRKQVTGKEEEIKAHQKSIKEKEAQIEKLKKEIEQHKAALEKTKSTINNAAAKVQLTNDKFMTAYNVVKGQIVTDIEKMEKYLA